MKFSPIFLRDREGNFDEIKALISQHHSNHINIRLEWCFRVTSEEPKRDSGEMKTPISDGSRRKWKLHNHRRRRSDRVIDEFRYWDGDVKLNHRITVNLATSDCLSSSTKSFRRCWQKELSTDDVKHAHDSTSQRLKWELLICLRASRARKEAPNWFIFPLQRKSAASLFLLCFTVVGFRWLCNSNHKPHEVS